MRVFLCTEILFFGGLFTAYVVYRERFHGVFAQASEHLDVALGATNTMVLICSSLTMALAIWSAHMNRRKMIVVFLLITMLFGLTFLGIKTVEYASKFQHHLVPGPNFHYVCPANEPCHPEQAEIFFALLLHDRPARSCTWSSGSAS